MKDTAAHLLIVKFPLQGGHKPPERGDFDNKDSEQSKIKIMNNKDEDNRRSKIKIMDNQAASARWTSTT